MYYNNINIRKFICKILEFTEMASVFKRYLLQHLNPLSSGIHISLMFSQSFSLERDRPFFSKERKHRTVSRPWAMFRSDMSCFHRGFISFFFIPPTGCSCGPSSPQQLHSGICCLINRLVIRRSWRTFSCGSFTGEFVGILLPTARALEAGLHDMFMSFTIKSKIKK